MKSTWSKCQTIILNFILRVEYLWDTASNYSWLQTILFSGISKSFAIITFSFNFVFQSTFKTLNNKKQKTYRNCTHCRVTVAHTIGSDAVHGWSKLGTIWFYCRWGTATHSWLRFWDGNQDGKQNQLQNCLLFSYSSSALSHLGRTCSRYLRDTSCWIIGLL